MAEKITDILTYVLSLALAAAVIAFAAYKVVVLNGMENPPANLGLNFPPAKRRVITDAAPGADAITTQSISPVSPDVGPDAAARAPQLSRPGRPYDYELLTVVDGVAFVAVDGSDQKTLVPVTVGSRLPGGETVEAIRRRDGRWALVAGKLTLDQSFLPPQ